VPPPSHPDYWEEILRPVREGLQATPPRAGLAGLPGSTPAFALALLGGAPRPPARTWLIVAATDEAA